jgi:hypothetical protein
LILRGSLGQNGWDWAEQAGVDCALLDLQSQLDILSDALPDLCMQIETGT